jgi:predicted transcriptional regulator
MGLMKNAAPAPKTPQRVEEVRQVFEENYLEYQYRFVEFFIEHLSDVSRTFRGDLQAVVVLALVGQLQLRELRLAGKQDAGSLPPERLSIAASRIADITGIPRQTVRRKLAALEDRGWVVRNAEGAFRIAVKDGQATAKTDLSELDARSLDRVARLFRDLETLVAARTDPEGGRS